MQNLTCFIASAFGYSDVDLIYNKSIRPMLKDLKIRPLRVDKINHNDKIDNKIITLINECDFGIVDLTYSRPSAYFEAGFIEGLGKKVIYISRKDHFRQKDSDIFGNEKIHFDLITKNIIPWINPNIIFEKALKARISLITKPILTRLKISQGELNSKREFEMLSLNDRIKLITESLKIFLLKTKFKADKDPRFANNTFIRNELIVKIGVTDSLTKGNLFSINILKEGYKQEKFIWILCSIKSVPRSRIEKALRLYDPIGNKIFQSGNTKIIILDSINSIENFYQKLKTLQIK